MSEPGRVKNRFTETRFTTPPGETFLHPDSEKGGAVTADPRLSKPPPNNLS